MKTKYILFGIAVFAVVLTTKLMWPTTPAKNVSTDAKFSRVITEKISPAKVAQVREFVQQKFSENAGTVEPEACTSARERLLKQKIDEIVQDISDRRSILDATCATFDSKIVAEDLAQAIYKNCQREDLIAGENKETCWQALVFYKANLVAKAFGDQNLKNADTETLIYLFMAKISRAEFTSAAQVAYLNELTDRLVADMPDSPSARKAATIPRVVADFENMSQGKELNPIADEYLTEAIRLNIRDQELQEVATLRRVYEPGEKISVSKAEALVLEQPKSSIAQYFLAGAYENAGRRKDAISAARHAYEMEPSNQRYKDTLDKLVRGEKKAFMIQMGVSFDSL